MPTGEQSRLVLLTLAAVALSQRPAYARVLMSDEYAVQAFLRQREAWLSGQFSSPDASLDDGPAPIRLITLNARITFFHTHTHTHELTHRNVPPNSDSGVCAAGAAVISARGNDD